MYKRNRDLKLFLILMLAVFKVKILLNLGLLFSEMKKFLWLVIKLRTFI